MSSLIARGELAGTLKSGWVPCSFCRSSGERMEDLQAAVGLSLPVFFWSAKQYAQIILLELYGKPNSDANHSRSPVIAHKTPLLRGLPLHSIHGAPQNGSSLVPCLHRAK